jgi:hypothetical protein
MSRAFLIKKGGGGAKASRGRQSGRNAEEANSDSSPQGQTLSLSLSRDACNPYYEHPDAR